MEKLIFALLFLAIILFCMMLYMLRYRRARIYNWDGERYHYLGLAPISREAGGYAVYIGEKMVDISYTTRYRICPDNAFCRHNRLRELYVYAEGSRRYLVIGEDALQVQVP